MKVEHIYNWQVTEEELKRYSPVGVLVSDPEFKLGQDIKDALRERKVLVMCGKRREIRALNK